MDDIAVFKLDSLPELVFTVTRTTEPVPPQRANATGTIPQGFLNFVSRRELPKVVSQAGFSGPAGPEMVDTPRIHGGKVPFVFRTLPGYTFYAIRYDQEIVEKGPLGQARRAPAGMDSHHLLRTGRRRGA
jgi:hypothetical protein